MANAKEIVDQVWTLMETHQIEKLPQFLDADLHFKMPGFEGRGPAALQQLLQGYLTAFPDLRHQVKTEIAMGDYIAIELDATGTHTGPMHTPQGTVAPTGKKVVWESCDVVRVRNGKILSWHVYHDTLPVMTALGLIRP
jgi:ketosteroid isomerase-like protein